MYRKKTPIYVFMIFFVGSIVGTVMGKLVAFVLPEGSVVHKFFLVSGTWGVQPFTVDIGLLNITFGFTLELNVIGILGIAFAAYLLKYYL